MGDLAGLRADASPQDGQFALAQARARGFTRSALANLRASGEIATLRRNVARFTVAGGDPDPAITAALACWPHGVISHASAALHHRVARGLSAEPPHVTVTRGSMCSPVGVIVHVTRYLPGCDIVKVGALRYTSLARTVCDLADGADLWETLSRVDDAVARGARPGWIHQRATVLANGRSGVAAIAAATAPGASHEFRSWLERAGSHVFRAASLPDAEWNVPIFDAAGKIGLADALWRWYRVIAELEGLRFHTSAASRRTDAKRFNRFAEAGYQARRFTWRDLVDDPVDVAGTVLRALNSRGANLASTAIPRRIELPERPFLGR